MAGLTTQQVLQIGVNNGLSESESMVLAAIVQSESPSGVPGDYVNGQPTSFGVLQFHIGGVLTTFAQALGKSIEWAAQYVTDNPQYALEWAIGPGGYIRNAIKAGENAGYSGASLATYVSANGQRSVYPANAGSAYTQLFGSSTSGTGISAGGAVGAPTSGGTPTPGIPAPSNGSSRSGPGAVVGSTFWSILEKSPPPFGQIFSALNTYFNGPKSGGYHTLVTLAFYGVGFSLVIVGLLGLAFMGLDSASSSSSGKAVKTVAETAAAGAV